MTSPAPGSLWENKTFDGILAVVIRMRSEGEFEGVDYIVYSFYRHAVSRFRVWDVTNMFMRRWKQVSP